MSAKPKPFDPYARMDGPMVSQQLIDDLRGPSPSAAAMAWVARSIEDAEAAPAPIRVLKAFQFNILGKGRGSRSRDNAPRRFWRRRPFRARLIRLDIGPFTAYFSQ